ncbi:MAG TPA: nuclear transport factor 2 family protein [Rhodanobacteraceae bacterium]|nr:nuclear transport factor 2 family protein [Rhodanobacteraceae bacterium]
MNKQFIALTIVGALVAVSTMVAAQQTTPAAPAMHKSEPGGVQAVPGMQHMQGMQSMQNMQGMMKPSGAPAAEAAVQAFHDALTHGDRAAALAMLAPDAQITEDGKTQSRAEYAAHHLPEDIAFLKNAKIKLLSRRSMGMGERAQVASDTEISASSKGKPVVLRSHEQMELKRIGGQWKITSIRWTSQRAPR